MGLRSRNIKPGFFRNEHLANLPMAVRLLFAGLWCAADREGRFEYRPKRLHAEIFPYSPEVDVEAGILHLARLGFLYIYTVEGHNCQIVQIINFKKHQTPHHTEKQSVLPPCPDFTVSSPLTHGEYSSDSLISDSLISDSLISDSLIPDSLSESSKAHALSREKGSSKMPEGFAPNERHIALARELGVDIEQTFLKFRDHHESKGTEFQNWDAAFLKWIRNEPNFNGGSSPERFTRCLPSEGLRSRQPEVQVPSACQTCGGLGQLRQRSNLPGPRLFPCPACSQPPRKPAPRGNGAVA